MCVAAALLLLCAPINGMLPLQLRGDEDEVTTLHSLQAKSLWVISPPLPTMYRESSTLLTAKCWSFETSTTTLEALVSG